MKYRITGASLAIVLLVGGVIAGESVKSGLEPGKSCMPFNPLNVNGAAAGQKVCQV
jgi:hypothetical protein